jgi:hypothetical protein
MLHVVSLVRGGREQVEVIVRREMTQVGLSVEGSVLVWITRVSVPARERTTAETTGTLKTVKIK